MVDMGGASVQVAFELDGQDTFHGENYEVVNLGCSDSDETYT